MKAARSLRVVVVGIPGVGKTTVVEKAAESVRAKVVTFGTVMFEEALKLRWAKGRDDMRKMPIERQRRLQELAAARISRARDPVLFVDTHLFIRTPEGLWPGLPYDVLRGMKPTHLVLFEATPEEIRDRRASDATRARDSLSLEALASELALGRSFLSAASTLTGSPMLILANRAGMSEEAARELAEALPESRVRTAVVVPRNH